MNVNAMSRNTRLLQNNAAIQKKSPPMMMQGVVLNQFNLSLLCFSSTSVTPAVCFPSVAVDSVVSIIWFRWILPPHLRPMCCSGATKFVSVSTFPHEVGSEVVHTPLSFDPYHTKPLLFGSPHFSHFSLVD